MTSWYLASKNVCADGKLEPRWIEIEGGKIRSVLERPPGKGRIEDVGDLAVLPGVVDSHVHVNEPGRTEWEGFETATQAAAAGGATTLVDMPLNCIPVTVSAAALKEKLGAVRGKLAVDVGFWGGATSDNGGELPGLLDAGVLGVKTFTIDSGIPEFPPMTLEQIDRAMPELARRGLPYLFHAELDDGVHRAQGPDYETFLLSRPKSWENNAIEGILRLAEKHRARVHIVHLSSAEALPLISRAKMRGVRVTVETCPHYLCLSAAQVGKYEPAAERTLFKCCPPIREEENRRALWQGLKAGVIDMIVSDHSPCTPALKRFAEADFGTAWGGIASLQYTLPLLWTEGLAQDVSLPQLARWTAAAPAQLAGLERRKGVIAPGMDADFAVFDPGKAWTVTEAATYHRHKGSPYRGRTLQGKVVRTILRGETIYDDGKFPSRTRGEFLLKGAL
jgi:allantoinase